MLPKTVKPAVNQTMKTQYTSVPPSSAFLLFGMLLLACSFVTGCTTSPSGKNMSPAAAMVDLKPDLIVLREGDVVKVSFPGSANLDSSQPIRRDGKILLPLIGEVTAAGLTPEALQTNLSQLYAPQISTKQLIVTVVASSFPVFVTGAVVHPGKILSDHPLTALDAVMEAGGFMLTTANLKDVRVIRNENGVMKKYSLNLKLLLDGKDSQPFYLKPSDIIFVPERFTFF
jgi:polysaccharide export outer membrane protein